MIRFSRIVLLSAFLALQIALPAQDRQPGTPSISLPTSKNLTIPAPGRIGSTNSFPATIAISPDGRYAALLNNGFGTQETMAMQSIAVLDLKTNQLIRLSRQAFRRGSAPELLPRLSLRLRRQTSLSLRSVPITDATGQKPPDTGNGIAVYNFTDGKVVPERFIAIEPQALAPGKKVAIALRKTPPGTAIPYPAGLALVSARGGHDRLLVANNLSDNAVLLDVASGKVLQRFDLSTSDLVPSSFPYTCVVTRDGRRAWCSLWNASRIAELDLTSGKVAPLDQAAGTQRSDCPRLTSHSAAAESRREHCSTWLCRMRTRLRWFQPKSGPDSCTAGHHGSQSRVCRGVSQRLGAIC